MAVSPWKSWSVVALLLAVISGCSKPAAPPAVKTTSETAVPAPVPAATLPAEPSTTAPSTPMAKPQRVADVPSTSSTPPAVPVKDAGDQKKVVLGSPELTAGIPGGGDLEVDEIKKWLADPKNHETLDVELPLGLSAGNRDIQGLKDNPLTRAKIELGRQLYFDTRLSIDQTVSCSSCHDPAEDFAAHTQFGIGVKKQQGGRNSPVSYNRILSTKQFWDGRADSLEDQALGPIANPIEMGHTHEACVSCLKEVEGYRLQFEKIFGALSIENVGKAIASFERAIVSGPSPYDYYQQLHQTFAGIDPEDLKTEDPEQYKAYEKAKAEAEAHPMSESAVRGLKIYFADKGSCSACHVGPNLTDEKYHNLGIGMDAKKPDLGRFEITKDEKEKGAFKTPTIRNVALSAPYMHDGSLKTLEEVVDWYDKGGHPNPQLDPKIKKLNLSKQDKADLVAFMNACTGEFPKIERGRIPADSK